MPRLRSSPLSMESGCSLRNDTRQSGSPVISTSKCSPSGPKRQGGSRCSSPISQLTAAVTTGSPSTRPSHRKRCAATRPGWIGPIGESIGAVATAISWVVRSDGSRSKPSSSATMWTDWRKPAPSASAMMLWRDSSGVLPNSIQSRITSGAPYVRMSENSSARTRVMELDSAETMSGKRSVMPPGWMPVPCRVTPAARHTASSWARSSAGG